MSLATPNIEARIDAYIARQTDRGMLPRPGAIASYLRAVPRPQRQQALAYLRATYPDYAPEVEAVVAERNVPTENTYTTAPASYDGFGTETIAVVGTLDGKEVRQVATPVEHVEWQRCRYGSGLYPGYTLREFMDVIRQPWAKYAPIPEVTTLW